MTRKIVLILGTWGCLALSVMPIFAQSIVVRDDADHEVKLVKPASRIISLAPDITEILFALGCGDRIVGTVSASDYPPQAKKIVVVGSFSGLDMERIISLKPDLIVTWDHSFLRQLQWFKARGIPVYETLPRQLADVAHTLQQLGTLTQQTKRAHDVADNYLRELSQLKRRYADSRSIRVFYHIGHGALTTINQTSWIDQAITVCGGQNVFGQTIGSVPRVNWESVLSADPEVVVSDRLRNDFHDWLKWHQIKAVRKGNLYIINPDLIDRAGPRLLEGVKIMCQFIDQARHDKKISI